ncbi:MAG: hypothetical protein EOO09_10040 [Chitinophagaceae bacterium]|nr:MAG: hypothetical protein EOO09_10040 [Chitinophagaceae bacterium]
MNYICTWLCADEKGEESLFPQTGQLSSSKSHQDIYWRCLLLFYISSKRFNKTEQHLLFTNLSSIPDVDGRDVGEMLSALGVRVIHTDFKYKTPKGYYGSFQNQFYEFSILEEISATFRQPDDLYLIVDSDCVFLKPAAPLFSAAAAKNGFISFRDDVKPGYVINGLSRYDLKELYEDIMGRQLSEMPDYHLGEFLLASAGNINKFFFDFRELWPRLIERHKRGQKKFNEEAHTLSFLYFKNGFRAEQQNRFMKRIWTNPLFYRNVSPGDVSLALWHLPSEKTFGLRELYDALIGEPGFGAALTDEQYVKLAQDTLGVPHLSFFRRLKYYRLSYYRALKKRVKRTRPALQSVNIKTSAA